MLGVPVGVVSGGVGVVVFFGAFFFGVTLVGVTFFGVVVAVGVLPPDVSSPVFAFFLAGAETSGFLNPESASYKQCKYNAKFSIC